MTGKMLGQNPPCVFGSSPQTFCCVVGQDTLLSQCLSSLPANLMLVGNPSMDWYPIQMCAEILHDVKTRTGKKF